jgi:hypothetical protein
MSRSDGYIVMVGMGLGKYFTASPHEQEELAVIARSWSTAERVLCVLLVSLSGSQRMMVEAAVRGEAHPAAAAATTDIQVELNDIQEAVEVSWVVLKRGCRDLEMEV